MGEASEQRPEAIPVDPLDPAARRMVELGPPFPPSLPRDGSVGPAELVTSRARLSIEELLPRLVRQIAWGGDRHRGTVRLELGAGPHAGTLVTVHADRGRVRVEIDGGGDASALRERIDERLRRHGLAVESVR